MQRRFSLLRRIFAPAVARARNFARDERGVTVVEFAILALPFFTLVFAILETSVVFLAGQVLDSAVEDASRMIRTGRAQAANYTIANFRSLMCTYTFDMFGDCSQILIRVRVIPDFASANVNPAAQTCDATTCTWSVPETFTAGTGRQIVQVSVYYRWPLMVTLPYFNLKNQPDNFRLFAATRVFRNEPFTTAATP